jgi:hypothetical protein
VNTKRPYNRLEVNEMDKTASAIVCDMQIEKALMPANVSKWIVPKVGVCDMAQVHWGGKSFIIR